MCFKEGRYEIGGIIYDTGDRPSVTVLKNGHVLEVHNDGSDSMALE